MGDFYELKKRGLGIELKEISGFVKEFPKEKKIGSGDFDQIGAYLKGHLVLNPV